MWIIWPQEPDLVTPLQILFFILEIFSSEVLIPRHY